MGPKKTDDLEVMVVGDFKLWLQHGPLALLAAVVSGQPPAELREVLVAEVEAIHRDFAGPLHGVRWRLRGAGGGGGVAAAVPAGRAEDGGEEVVSWGCRWERAFCCWCCWRW